MEKPDVLFCGSAAAEGIPAYFCDCPVCREAARRGGKEIRKRTSYNFGGVVQIDFGPDILQAFHTYRDRMNRIRHVLVTHAHEDHLSPEELAYLRDGFCTVPTQPDGITLHGTRPTFERIDRELDPGATEDRADAVYASGRLRTHVFRTFDVFDLPDAGATVRTYRANHSPPLEPVVYVVTLGGRTVLFGNDTGYFPEDSWSALGAARGELRLDVVILDDTGAMLDWRDGHMGAPAVLDTFSRLESLGLSDRSTVKAVNHFSHNGRATHADLEAFYGPRGIRVGYDGLLL
ncbi:MAG: MBL fold metallo-hydrolase [Kiritimatiellia bacterium]|jgi:phosphoribosyl 1,2-cyclic phosphate phosphodiesterase